jgi:hypothetical protein
MCAMGTVRPTWVLMFVVVLAGVAPLARAFVGVFSVPSVDAIVTPAQSVVVGRLVRNHNAGSTAAAWRVEVVETLKGAPRAGPIDLDTSDDDTATLLGECLARGGRVAVCSGLPELEGRLVRYVGAFESGYARTASGLVVFDLNLDPPAAFRVDLARVPTGAALLAAIREAAAYRDPASSAETLIAPRPPVTTGVRLPSSLVRTGRPGGVEFGQVLLPVDARLMRAAERWMRSPDPEFREAAAEALAAIPTKDAIARLRQMRDDPAYRVSRMSQWLPWLDTRWRRHYPVRMAVRGALQSHGLPPEVDGEGPDAPYSAVGWGWAAFTLALVLAAGLLAGWMSRRRGGRFAGPALASASVVAMAVVWAADLRSRDAQDCAALATAAAEHELISVGGKLAWLRVASEPGPHGWVAATFDDRSYWFNGLLAASTPEEASQKFPGVRYVEGTTVGDNAYPFQLLTVRYALVMTALALCPTWLTLSAALRHVRRRRRIRRNRCPACGYDLRGTPAAGRCPECGLAKVGYDPAPTGGA